MCVFCLLIPGEFLSRRHFISIRGIDLKEKKTKRNACCTGSLLSSLLSSVTRTMASFVDDKIAFLSEKCAFKSVVESCFLKYAEKNAFHETRRTSVASVTVLTVSGTRTDDVFRVDCAQFKEYSANNLDQAANECKNIIRLSVYCLAHLHKRGLLLNAKEQMSKTGKVLILVLSFVLLEARRILNDDQLTSISIVVGNMVENRQDRLNGLDVEVHRRFRPWSFQSEDGSVSIEGVWALGEIREEHGKQFFLEIAEVFRRHAEQKNSLILLTSKGTEAGLSDRVLPMLSERAKFGIDLTSRGHPSCTSSTGKQKTQAASSDILRSVMNGRGPSRGRYLNAWLNVSKNQNLFAPSITVEAVSANSGRTTAQSVSKKALLDTYETTESKMVNEAEEAEKTAAREAAEKAAREAAEKVAEDLKAVEDLKELTNKILFNMMGTKDEEQDFFANIDAAQSIINNVNFVKVSDAMDESLEDLRDIESERTSLVREISDKDDLKTQITRLETSRAATIGHIHKLFSLISLCTSKKRKSQKSEQEASEREKKQTQNPVDYFVAKAMAKMEQ